MQLLGAPKRLVAAAAARRRVAASPGVDIVADAVLPLIRRYDVKTYDPTDKQPFAGWKAGVYDKQKHVCEASLLDRHWTRVTVPFWPREICLDELRWRRGDAMYGGLLFHHFGRFLLETTNRLWWCLAERFRGPIIFQNTKPHRRLPDFARRYFSLLGLADQVVITDRPLGYARIVVPHRSYIGQRCFHDEFQAPFLAAAAAVEQHPIADTAAFGAGMAGLYLSRTRVATRSSVGELLIEKTFADAGFYIAHTQDVSLDAQILLVRRHAKIAGIAGSAFHNILFSDKRLRPLYICKDYDINNNFLMIDELMNNDGTFIYAGCADEAEMQRPQREIMGDHWNDVVLDNSKVLRCLADTTYLAT